MGVKAIYAELQAGRLNRQVNRRERRNDRQAAREFVGKLLRWDDLNAMAQEVKDQKKDGMVTKKALGLATEDVKKQMQAVLSTEKFDVPRVEKEIKRSEKKSKIRMIVGASIIALGILEGAGAFAYLVSSYTGPDALAMAGIYVVSIPVVVLTIGVGYLVLFNSGHREAARKYKGALEALPILKEETQKLLEGKN